MALSATSASIAVEFATATAWTRELRQFPFGRLSFGTRQRGAYQPPMDRTFIFSRTLLNLVVGGGWTFPRLLSHFFHERGCLCLHRHLFGERLSRNNFLRDVFGGRILLAAR